MRAFPSLCFPFIYYLQEQRNEPLTPQGLCPRLGVGIGGVVLLDGGQVADPLIIFSKSREFRDDSITSKLGDEQQAHKQFHVSIGQLVSHQVACYD